MSDNIYLTGFMGAGKTTVGKSLAELLNRKFVDLDQVLEKELGTSINEIFSSRGEEYFRDQESRFLEKISRRNRIVAATGGGVVQRENNLALMKQHGRTVYLETDLDACARRLGERETASRPLWRDRAALTALFEKRKPLYSRADLVIPVDDLGPGDLARGLAAGLFPEKTFQARLDREECPVVGSWSGEEELADVIKGRKTALLTDANVDRLHADRFRKALDPALNLVVPAGERSKTLDRAGKIYQALLDGHFDRGDVLVGLGGGVVTDLGAFVAATFKRGMKFALVSTTLLGAVDAAVGGKAAVNLGQAKNSVGCFTVPEKVVLDARALRTLRLDQVREGLVEAYKTGLVASPELAAFVENDLEGLLSRDLPLLFKLAAWSARTKADVVGRDFRESGSRAILNFGHTFGHAIEGWHNYKISHGRAVAMGLRVAVLVSKNRGLLPGVEADRIQKTLGLIMANKHAWPPLDQAWELMKHDKKIRQGRMVFVLLEGPGRPVLSHDVLPEELARALSELEA
ncbi:MAG: bifunctional shikimate kinase/3-dehydroquinate synthase [Pseudomonadota bacterium]